MSAPVGGLGPEGIAVDTRYSPEQLELRSATAGRLADLGPWTVADLDDDGRARLTKAAESSGWYDLRGPGEGDGPLSPLRSGVEIAIVARAGAGRRRHTLLRTRHRGRPGASGRTGRWERVS